MARRTKLSVGGYPQGAPTSTVIVGSVVTTQIQTNAASGRVKSKGKIGVGGGLYSGDIKDYSVQYITGTVNSNQCQFVDGGSIEVTKKKRPPKKKIYIDGDVSTGGLWQTVSCFSDVHIVADAATEQEAQCNSAELTCNIISIARSSQAQGSEGKLTPDQWTDDDLVAIMELLAAA